MTAPSSTAWRPTPTPPPPPGARRDLGPWAAIALLVAVALAFADASVVALALPDLYVQFDATIVGVSWVLTSYALAVALAGLAGVVVLRRVHAATATGVGLVVFSAASLCAGLAPSLPVLIGVRAVQGIGAAALIAGALPVLRALTRSPGRAAAWWAAAGTVGAATGPALGGLVTQLFDWRAVFLVQAPLVLLALPAVLSARRRVVERETDEPRRPPGAAFADLAFLCTFGAGVGALFLAVLLLVVVWQLPPLAGALVVTAVPIGTFLARVVAGHLHVPARPVAGAALLAGGLATMALLPELSTWWVAAALLLCGLGFGLLADVLGPLAVPPGWGIRAATLSSSARHLGLVLGLVVIAPILGSQVMASVDAAAVNATSTLLDAPVSTRQKIAITLDIRDELRASSDGQTPELDEVFARNGAADDPDVARLRDDVSDAIAAPVTRAFRPAFAAAGVLGALAAIPALMALARAGQLRQERRRPVLATALAGGLVAAALVVPLATGPAGAQAFGAVDPGDPCEAPPDPFPGGGLDATAQRVVLSGLNGAACELGVGREELILSLDRRSGFDDVRWDRATVEDAVRAGVRRSLDDADDRGSIPGWMASALGWTVDHVPIRWFMEQLGIGPDS